MNTAIHVDDFQDRLSEVCGAFNIVPVSGQKNVTGSISQTRTSGFDLVEVAQNSHQIKRTAHDIRRDPGDHFFLIIQQSGHAVMEQDGQTIYLSPQDMMIVDSTLPSTFSYAGEASHQVSLHLPRVEQAHRFGCRISGGIHIRSNDPLARAMHAILASIQSAEGSGQLHVTEAFYSVLGAYLMNRALGQDGSHDTQQALRDRVREAMLHNYANPGFSVSELPGLLNVSARNLQRSFQRNGETLRDHLQALRLQAAVKRMRAQSSTGQVTLAQIAFESGFADLSTFHRQFRARFDATPGSKLKDWRTMQ